MKDQKKNSANRDVLEDGKILKQCDILGGRLNKQKSDTKMSGFQCNILTFMSLECSQCLLRKLSEQIYIMCFAV